MQAHRAESPRRKRLDEPRDELVAPRRLEIERLLGEPRHEAEARADPLGHLLERLGLEDDDVARDARLELARRVTGDDLAFVEDADSVAVLGFLGAMGGD